jgi:hypothetical protein
MSAAHSVGSMRDEISSAYSTMQSTMKPVDGAFAALRQRIDRPWWLHEGVGNDRISLFHKVLKTGTPAEVQEAIDVHVDLMAAGEQRIDAMVLAARFNSNPDVVTIFLRAGVDINARGGDGDPPLSAATENQSPGVVAALLKAGADVNARAKDGFSPLTSAIILNRNPEVINKLLEAGADVNARDEDGSTPLGLAVSFQGPEVIITLLKAGADAKVKSGSFTPLEIAALKQELKGTVAYRLLQKASQ